MLRDIFGLSSSGRLQRGRFTLYWLGLTLAYVVAILALAASAGIAERLAGGDLAATHADLVKALALPALIALLALAALYVFGMLNIVAKRGRDIGVAGWIAVLVFLVAAGVSNAATRNGVGASLSLLVLIVLSVLPADSLRSKR